MIRLVKADHARPILLLTPQLDEIQQRKAYRMWREGLFEIAAEERLPIVDLLSKWQADIRESRNPLRDSVHPNVTGNKEIAMVLANSLSGFLFLGR
jgi:lysophospholipase L1-like esterase